MMNLKDIARMIAADEKDLTIASSERIVAAVFEKVKNGVDKKIDVRIPGFGIFKSKDTKARIARNPRTGEEVKVKASRRVGFTASRDFKRLLKK